MKMIRKILICLLAAMLLCSAAAEESPEVPLLEVHQMNLGFADGYYIRCGDFEMMIDGGKPMPFSVNDDVPRTLRELGADELDVYVITHWHLDHCENVNVVLEEFGTQDTIVYSPSVTPPEKVHKPTRSFQVLPLANGTYQQMKMGDVLQFGGITITCVGPEKLRQNGCTNMDSLNFVLQYGTRRFLFTGDFAQSLEINKYYKDLCKNVDVLKFPHHANQPYEIGVNACRTVNPTYVLVPGVTDRIKLWGFIQQNGRKDFEVDDIFYVANEHVVILTDGGERFDVLSKQDPKAYAPAK